MAGTRNSVTRRELLPPAWLASDAPHVDIALSSRCRILRNLCGYRFPTAADDSEMKDVLEAVLAATQAAGMHFQTFTKPTPVEREHFIAGRLASHGFDLARPGRAILLDEDRTVSVMVNEEDHLRIQGLTAGWSLPVATRIAERIAKRLAGQLEFAWSPRFGFLAASPHNLGEGRRLSAMFHLIGLAHSKRLPTVLSALTERGLTYRGLFGESSRAIGAFVQVSATSGSPAAFVGACDYLLREERAARSAVGRPALKEQAARALEFVAQSRSLSLVETLRILGWSRWASLEGLPEFDLPPRAIDALIAVLELNARTKEEHAARRRAEMLREVLGVD